jgi:hypothetical protein
MPDFRNLWRLKWEARPRRHCRNWTRSAWKPIILAAQINWAFLSAPSLCQLRFCGAKARKARTRAGVVTSVTAPRLNLKSDNRNLKGQKIGFEYALIKQVYALRQHLINQTSYRFLRDANEYRSPVPLKRKSVVDNLHSTGSDGQGFMPSKFMYSWNIGCRKSLSL